MLAPRRGPLRRRSGKLIGLCEIARPFGPHRRSTVETHTHTWHSAEYETTREIICATRGLAILGRFLLLCTFKGARGKRGPGRRGLCRCCTGSSRRTSSSTPSETAPVGTPPPAASSCARAKPRTDGPFSSSLRGLFPPSTCFRRRFLPDARARAASSRSFPRFIGTRRVDAGRREDATSIPHTSRR